MAQILAMHEDVIFDESIAHYEVHAYQPYASSSYNNNNEIQIAIQDQNLYLLPKIDRNSNVGVTSVIKGYESQSPRQVSILENAGWLMNDTTSLNDANGNFGLSIPMSTLLGFAEHYLQVVFGARHKLIIKRTDVDINAVMQTADEDFKITLEKMKWMMPSIKVSDKVKVGLLDSIAKDPIISMSFRTWELYEYPLLPATTKQIWAIKTSTQLEKPRYVVLRFQTARKKNLRANANKFDHCNIHDVQLYLNSQCYPYANLNLDIANNQFALLYDMYANFQTSYYNKESEPLLSKAKFLEQAPLVVIDCSKQNESLKTGPVDVRLEFELGANAPAGTTAFCLILHDRIVQYNPISGNVQKLM
ncbi:uncharacterized protein LOC130676902 [Microplitis mediator]|uniref:uncharacterized protein LOC130676902 n=1 Tax=Microplitis mediator TaxID=375433 RepID=UPI0025536586|nr:uncharacterized protein LOC130676902 [Microplitis mediator]